ncbi:MAG: T9SS type A sorting domain-containing protein [Bacteroidetes bacterium]|nr:T9SS type A sorting domain-containing protein [Bacteroidota bacterium]
MKKTLFLIFLAFQSILLPAQVHTTYLWHLQQPIYWPAQSVWNPYGYQSVWESQWRKDNAGESHPLNDLYDIFSKDDRKAIYQFRAKDAVQTLTGYSEAGAQVNYSGCLIENVNSLATAGQWGYYTGWENDYRTARSWTTSGGKPRLDIVGFTFHHALSPLIGDDVLRKEIQAHKYIYALTFGNTPVYSKGFWPAECSFSERIIKVLVEEGFEWSVIANSHLARTLADYPLQFGTSGCNIDPPNRADKMTTNGTNWWNGQIDGRGGAFASPYCYQAHKAKYVDPATGTEYLITVVPMADLLSYQNGYGTMGTGEIASNIAPYSPAGQPCIVLMAHDGDNAWGGGYDYYMNSVPGFAGAASSAGYVPSTVQQFLTDHPVPTSDVVHVEDGSWFNAANDWGHPQFINWIWPMYNTNYEFDPNGWTEDARNWAVLTAAENHVKMAEDLSGTLDIADIVSPSASSSNAEKAWHHLLPGYTSGYMYYGTSLDMEVKQTVAANLAVGYADQVISANPGVDNTAPAVFVPQRYPYNPGGIGFGPNYGYQQHTNPSDFTVWTFAYDVSGIQSAVLKYRVDFDGSNPLSDNENETYTGGSGVSNWNSVSMTARPFPTGNITGNPEIDFFILPTYIATEYYGAVTGLHDTLVDYYVEITDNNGNTTKSAIQHVYIGAENSGNPQDGVYWTPAYPSIFDTITITVTDATMGAKLHWGIRLNNTNWQQPLNSYWPVGSTLFNGTGPAIQSDFLGPDADNEITIKIGPLNDTTQVPQAVNFVIHWNNDTWDNNNGADYYIPVTTTPTSASSITDSSTGGLVLFPNPAKDEISYRVYGNHQHRGSFCVRIFNASGQIVSEKSGMATSGKLSISTLPPGIYTLSAQSETDKAVFYQRLVVGKE